MAKRPQTPSAPSDIEYRETKPYHDPYFSDPYGHHATDADAAIASAKAKISVNNNLYRLGYRSWYYEIDSDFNGSSGGWEFRNGIATKARKVFQKYDRSQLNVDKEITVYDANLMVKIYQRKQELEPPSQATSAPGNLISDTPQLTVQGTSAILHDSACAASQQTLGK